MRNADITTAWREMRTKPRKRLSVNSITISSRGRDYLINSDSRILAIVGQNGAGKTRILRSLCLALSGRASASYDVNVSAISGQYKGGEFAIPNAAGPANSPEVIFADCALVARSSLAYISGQNNFQELLTQFGANAFSPSALDAVRKLCNRNYSAVDVREIDAPVGASSAGDLQSGQFVDDVIPIFSVTVGNASYDSAQMGFGELCAFVLIWIIARADKGKIFIFDEPDAHLSSRSRSSMMDVLAFFAHDREHWIALSSHAPEAIRALQPTEYCFVETDNQSLAISARPAAEKRSSLLRLGLLPTKRLLLITEDEDAREILRLALRSHEYDLLSHVDIEFVSGGAEAVVNFINCFPQGRNVRAMCVLDGDKRQEVSLSRRILFLPGDCDPVLSAKAVALANLEEFANGLAVSAEALKRALGAASHLNHHDFCAALAGELHINNGVSVVRGEIAKIWLAQPDVAIAVRDLVGRIDAELADQWD